MVTQNQLITAGMGQVLDINILAIFKAIDEYPDDIQDRWGCMLKVKLAFNHFKPDQDGGS
jgi:hypothetical protein